MRIAHFGTFDVDNYGDLLFPHVAEWRWPEAEWVHVSPVAGATRFADARPTVPPEEAASLRFDAVVVGGGNILRLRRSSLPVYAPVAASAYAGLWLGAAELATAQGVPLLVNAPSVSAPRAGVLERRLLGRTLAAANYAALRDPGSVALAQHAGVDAAFVPDTAFDVARMWPLPAGEAAGDGSLAVHVNKRYLASVEEVAARLDALAERRDGPVRLVPIGPCHGDVETEERVAAAMRHEVEIVPVTTLREMAHVIGRSSHYVGSSMHGFITALAYRRPALLVLNASPLNKFEGVLRWARLSDSVVAASWRDVPDDLSIDLRLTDVAAEELRSVLDVHWGRLREAAHGGKPAAAPLLARGWRSLAFVAAFETRVTKRLRRAVGGG